MASLIKVDEMEAYSTKLMKFNTGAFTERQDAPASNGTVTWDPETSPVVVITNTGEPEPSEITVAPIVTSAKGMYMTVIYPQGAVVTLNLNSFEENTVIPDCSSGPVHRVYYSHNSLWWDA
jgi:hypothetical protein